MQYPDCKGSCCPVWALQHYIYVTVVVHYTVIVVHVVHTYVHGALCLQLESKDLVDVYFAAVFAIRDIYISGNVLTDPKHFSTLQVHIHTQYCGIRDSCIHRCLLIFQTAYNQLPCCKLPMYRSSHNSTMQKSDTTAANVSDF